MNKRTEHKALLSWKAACLIAWIFAAFAMVGCSPKPTTRPIPKGDAMIHVEFKGLSSDEFNNLTAFVRKLAEGHSTFVKGSTGERDVGDHDAYTGIWNDGFVDQKYKPNHPIPSPEVEATMKGSLESHLHDKGMKGRDVKLELRYGL